MKFSKVLFGVPVLFAVVVASSSQFAACTKEPVNDTTIIRDTVIVKDTVTIIDSVLCCSLTDGLIGYYNFDGGSLHDSSGLHHDIAFNNATPAADRFGKANSAFQFDGSSSYMTVPDNPDFAGLHAITIETEIYINGFYTGKCHGNQIVGKGLAADNGNGFFGIRMTDRSTDCSQQPNLNNETVNGNFGDDLTSGMKGFAEDSTPVVTGRWYHLVYTWDGYVAKFYTNGVLKGTVSGLPKETFTANASSLFIGKNENPQYPYYFNGVIDEIRIYNHALCPAAVTALYKLKK